MEGESINCVLLFFHRGERGKNVRCLFPPKGETHRLDRLVVVSIAFFVFSRPLF